MANGLANAFPKYGLGGGWIAKRLISGKLYRLGWSKRGEGFPGNVLRWLLGPFPFGVPFGTPFGLGENPGAKSGAPGQIGGPPQICF